MADNEFKELHDLLLGIMGLFYEKFLCKFRKESPNYPGVKKNHIRIMIFIYKNLALTASEIAKKLNMEKGSVTTLIDQLEKYGLVVRCSVPNDRRKTIICLTDTGKTEIEDTIKNSIQCISTILADSKPEELQKFSDSLRYAVDFIQKI
mgnify:CR=1 FL=1